MMTTRTIAFGLALGVLFTSGCEEGEADIVGTLEGPSDVSILPAGLLDVAVGFAVQERSGRIAKLDLEAAGESIGLQLVEDGPAGFIPAPPIATGRDRILSEIVALSDQESWITLLVFDAQRDVLLRVPYVVTEGDAREFVAPVLVGEAEFLNPDGSPWSDNLPELQGLRLQEGSTTSETWTLTWRDDREQGSWELRGTRSGLQQARCLPAFPCESDNGELDLYLVHAGGRPEAGSQIIIETDRRITELDLGGFVTDLVAGPDLQRAIAALQTDDGSELVLLDEQGQELARQQLPPGASAVDLSVSGDVVLVADAELHQVHQFTLLGDALALDTSWTFPGPVSGAVLGPDPSVDWIFATAAVEHEVWVLDRQTGEQVDINPLTPEQDAIQLGGLPLGIVAGQATASTWEFDRRGQRGAAWPVQVTTSGGFMWTLDAGTGCIFFELPDGRVPGPFVQFPSNYFEPVDGWSLLPEGGRRIEPNPCGGLAPTEVWRLTYDQSQAAWEAEGSISGPQVNLARENVRYVSDRGEFSLFIQSGAIPTPDGEEIVFTMNDGITPVDVGQLPGEPETFLWQRDPLGPWVVDDPIVVTVVPATGNDLVTRVDIEQFGIGGVVRYF